MAHGTVNGKPLTTNEHEDYQRQELEQQEEAQQRAEALALKLAQTYEELTRLLERNPGVKRQMTEGMTNEDKVYQKLKQRLKLAEMAPRCQWVRQDGTSCGSPQMKNHIYCFAHRQMAEARALALRLPAPEDANAILIGLMRIQKALIEDTITTKKAGLLLYSMQLALTGVGRVTFGQAKDEEMVRETMSEEEAFSIQQSAVSQEQNQNQNQKQRPFTAKDAKESKTLPRMDAEERGLQGEESSKDSEFVPVPGGYGFHRVRLRIEPELGAERRPVQAAVVPPGKTAQPGASVPHEHAQTHAILG